MKDRFFCCSGSLNYTPIQTNQPVRYYSYKQNSTALGEINKDGKNLIQTSKNYTLDPMWITGFFDGEGCFYVNISMKSSNKKYYVSPHIYLGLHSKDITILELLINNLKVGRINYKHGPNSVQLDVGSLHEIEILTAFFDKYPFLTKKKSDFLLFKKTINLIKMKKHLTESGLEEIVALKASMNLGLSQKLKVAFFNVAPANKPIVKVPNDLNPFWLAGFTSAEGSYMIKIQKSQTTRLGFSVDLAFHITQGDEKLLMCVKNFFNCGNVYRKGNIFDFVVTKFDDIINKIIPFFNKYSIIGVKSKDFNDFSQAAELINHKKHLTELGLNQIREIKAGMNKKRK